MPAAPELQARLAWRMLVTETAPPPIQVDDDRNASSPASNRVPPSPSSVASPHDQRGSSGVESKVQLTDVYSARCHWRPKHCGECDKLRLLNSRLVGRLQAAEAHIKVLTRDHTATLEDLAARLKSEGENQKLLETKLADIQPHIDLLEGITAEVNKRFEGSVGSSCEATVGTAEISTPAAPPIPWIGDDACCTPVKVESNPTAFANLSRQRSSPEELPLEEFYSHELQKSQRSLEDALLKSLKATVEKGNKAVTPTRQRTRPTTPDWPQRRQLQACSVDVASSADARRGSHRPGSSRGPRPKLLPGKARVEPGSNAKPPVPLPPRGSSRPRQSTERRASPC
mmetsp:Transcript_127593/g.248659  ORF Transcript_127593/g.248659 Transcript_127593/m.248659 type:complete len:342 (+) Transcript_127593:150-1175(+)|eukprot:CAMPEP_0172757510 /NCGR_PEP_ID=MMETSP1074-20121228/163982_1 /TAXON_ID=2916 /ORGANISM="Ceratium fusus, Strain PA161109" /LENGTH=341 /DNA_ID=CAMNT_0013590945 /DNA_START=75 /DNA_END=1100 /DNA_ORIENTATION=+